MDGNKTKLSLPIGDIATPVLSKNIISGKNRTGDRIRRIFTRDRLVLNSPEIYIIRSIHPQREVSTRELSEKGIRIGNDLDNTDSPVFHWSQDCEGGVKSKQYRMDTGGWPVYVRKDLESIERDFFAKKQYTEGVYYVQKVDLNFTKIWINLSRIYSDESGRVDTPLRLEHHQDGYLIKSEQDISSLAPSLQSLFTEDGYLTTMNAEFFLESYENSSAICEEKIFRYNRSGIIGEITTEVHSERK